jgi:hypothetical protein
MDEDQQPKPKPKSSVPPPRPPRNTKVAAAADPDEPDPKKKTTRINLPLKPTTAPTIKLPTLPPGGPTGTAVTKELAGAKPKKSWWKMW